MLERTSPTIPSMMSGARTAPVDWEIATAPLAYPDAVSRMEERVAAIREGSATEQVWLVQHPPLYTAGTSAQPTDLLDPDRFPVFPTGRGGQYTYHGPGQRVAYVMLDLAGRREDVRLYVRTLEEWLVRTLAAFGVRGERRDGRVGIWVARPELGRGRDDKIAAIGIRIRRWVTFHGIAINVDPDLGHFSSIVPCGVGDQGVTSLADLGVAVPMSAVDSVLLTEFEGLFGPTRLILSA